MWRVCIDGGMFLKVKLSKRVFLNSTPIVCCKGLRKMEDGFKWGCQYIESLSYET